ncbi:MAG: dihydrodipicolinate synthase family protein [Acidobacteriaceae bacterium]
MKWFGVVPAMTTCFNKDLTVDHGFMSTHARWMVENGCSGVVSLGSLGEAATLTFKEKVSILSNIRKSLATDTPVVAAVSSLSTQEAVELATAAADAGCQGLMVLPPYVYRGDWREMKEYLAAVFRATSLSVMLYNNPIAYGTDFLPSQIRELALEFENFAAVKESSADVRRVTSIREITGDRLQIFVGVDDLIVEAIGAGAKGWIAGLVNALPKESTALFDIAMNQGAAQAFEIYRWFLPLLRMDTVPKFVQLIKLVQQEVGMGNTRVRGPRLELTGAELAEARGIIQEALRSRPTLSLVSG